MSRWGKPKKNKRKVDPRYFLNEIGLHDTLPLADRASESEDESEDESETSLNPYDATYAGASEESVPTALRTAGETAFE